MRLARQFAMTAAVLLLAAACSQPAPASDQPPEALAGQPSNETAASAATDAAPAVAASNSACASPSTRPAGDYEEKWRGAELLEATPGTATCARTGQGATFSLSCTVRGPSNLSLDGYLFHTVPAGQTATYTLDANASATCTLN